MKKRLIIIASVILLCLLVLFTIYKVNTINDTKEKMVDIVKKLMDSISAEDYDGIRRTIRNIDGTELSDKQISNFLVNTGLYRAILIKEDEQIFTYSANVKFFNKNEGSVVFSFKALNGELITNEIEYFNTGINEYLITNNIQDVNIEKERYYMAVDLANGENIEYDNSKDNDIGKINILSYVQDEKGKVFVEIIKEAKEDIKLSLLNNLYDQKASLKNIDENYNLEWSDDFKDFSIYYDKSVDKKVIAIEMRIAILSCSSLIQVLAGNDHWSLTVNYYDYNTKQLLKTEKIR